MKTQKLKEPIEQAKGFVTPVKPNPLLSPKNSSKISKECVVETVIGGGGDTAQEVSEMDTPAVDISFNSLMIGYEEDGWKRKDVEESKKEGTIRKKEDDMQRKVETDAYKAKEEGRNSFSGKNLRQKTAGGSSSQSRHKTINVDKKVDVGTTPSKIQGLVLDEVTCAETGVSKGAFMNRASGDASLKFSEDDLQAAPVLVTSHEVIVQDKLHVKLHALAGDQSTYTCDPGDSFAKDWAGWLAELDLDRRQGDISELMLSNTNIR